MTIDFMGLPAATKFQKRTAGRSQPAGKSAINFNRPMKKMRSSPGCQISVYCGIESPGQCSRCSARGGLQNLSDDEVDYIIDNSGYPELMGAALKKKIKAAVKKVKKTVKKVVKKIPKPLKVAAAFLAPTTAITALATKAAVKTTKLATSKKERVKTAAKIKQAQKKVKANLKKLPKPLRVIATAALAPVMPTTLITAATTAATVKAGKLATSKKERVKAANKIKQVKKNVIANIKKLPKPLRVVAGLALAPLMPTTTAALLTAAPVVASAVATKKIAQKVQQVQQAKKAAAAAERAALPEPEEREEAVVPAAVKQDIESGIPTAAAMPVDEGEAVTETVTEAEKKKFPILPLVAAGAALLPLLLGQ